MRKTKSGAYIAENAVVKGNIMLGKDSSVWYHTTIRTDDTEIWIGKETNIQDNCVLHVDKGQRMIIGNRITIGDGAIVHCKEIGDGTLVGMGAILLSGASVGKGCIIGAGALVTQNMIVPDHSMVIGIPGKIIRKTTEEERQSNLSNACHYIEEAKSEVWEERNLAMSETFC